SASGSCGSSGATGQWYTWSSGGMLTDVQGWYSSPSSNNGWVLIGDESTGGTARRFVSREATDDAGDHFPELIITYTPGGGFVAPGPEGPATAPQLGGLRLLGER